ncbi:5-hydroxyisourate hydrolase [Hibiscus syriacus]|uniref:5-hydroxyisourate hydrolase n=1 Tax=Hibiscus syriacus TaxID=106335 RepID=A0A6A2XNX3_HIBSY|nr:5-hydroxyisourate hydrolase [Hibiscus syriacus]
MITLALQELSDWNARLGKNLDMYSDMCRWESAAEILGELKATICLSSSFKYPSTGQSKPVLNRPIELEIASQEQMKITELRLRKLFLTQTKLIQQAASVHRTSCPSSNTTTNYYSCIRFSKECPAAGIEVRLETWKGSQPRPSFGETDTGRWVLEDLQLPQRWSEWSVNEHGDALSPGVYRISFNTGKYNPGCFFPYVSIVFEIKKTQTLEHFPVPLLLFHRSPSQLTEGAS